MALSIGRAAKATWIWPSDSNQFLTTTMWKDLVTMLRQVELGPQRAVLVPMLRMPSAASAQRLRGAATLSEVLAQQPADSLMVSEPQIILSGNLSYHFPEGILYGAGNKLRALHYVCHSMRHPTNGYCCRDEIVHGLVAHGGESKILSPKKLS